MSSRLVRPTEQPPGRFNLPGLFRSICPSRSMVGNIIWKMAGKLIRRRLEGQETNSKYEMPSDALQLGGTSMFQNFRTVVSRCDIHMCKPWRPRRKFRGLGERSAKIPRSGQLKTPINLTSCGASSCISSWHILGVGLAARGVNFPN